MKSPESRSDASKVDAVPAHVAGKENDTSTKKISDASNPLWRHGGQHARMPLSPIMERQEQVQLKQEDPTMKKLRPAALNNVLRRNGIKSSSSTSAKDTVCLDAASAPNDETQLTKDVMKVPVDPPGSILGARPLMHYSNGPGTMYSEHGPASTVGGYLYGGGVHHRSFQPIFPPIWGYHPSSMPSSQHHHHTHQMQQQHQQQQQQQQQHQQQQQYETLNDSNHNRHPSQQWTMQQFLAPLVATVRHPFSNFMSIGNGIHGGNTWTSAGGDHHFGHMVHNSSNEQQNSYINSYDLNTAVPPSKSDDEVMSANASMDSLEGATQDIKEVVTEFVPTTFAPPECVKKIKARNEASAKLNSVKPRQTRSMTSATSGQQRRDGTLQSSSPKDSSRSKTKSPNAIVAVANQACSSRISISRGHGSGAKVAPVDAAIYGEGASELKCRTILGKRVTIIDEARKVFVIDLLSPEVCDEIRMMADDHTREIHKSGSNAENNWRTLYTYTKMDMPAVEVSVNIDGPHV